MSRSTISNLFNSDNFKYIFILLSSILTFFCSFSQSYSYELFWELFSLTFLIMGFILSILDYNLIHENINKSLFKIILFIVLFYSDFIWVLYKSAQNISPKVQSIVLVCTLVLLSLISILEMYNSLSHNIAFSNHFILTTIAFFTLYFYCLIVINKYHSISIDILFFSLPFSYIDYLINFKTIKNKDKFKFLIILFMVLSFVLLYAILTKNNSKNYVDTFNVLSSLTTLYFVKNPVNNISEYLSNHVDQNKKTNANKKRPKA